MVEHSPQILACEEKATTTTTTTTTKIQSLTYCLASMYTTHTQLIALVKEPVLVIDQSGERGWGGGDVKERRRTLSQNRTLDPGCVKHGQMKVAPRNSGPRGTQDKTLSLRQSGAVPRTYSQCLFFSWIYFQLSLSIGTRPDRLTARPGKVRFA